MNTFRTLTLHPQGGEHNSVTRENLGNPAIGNPPRQAREGLPHGTCNQTVPWRQKASIPHPSLRIVVLYADPAHIVRGALPSFQCRVGIFSDRLREIDRVLSQTNDPTNVPVRRVTP